MGLFFLGLSISIFIKYLQIIKKEKKKKKISLDRYILRFKFPPFRYRRQVAVSGRSKFYFITKYMYFFPYRNTKSVVSCDAVASLKTSSCIHAQRRFSEVSIVQYKLSEAQNPNILATHNQFSLVQIIYKTSTRILCP